MTTGLILAGQREYNPLQRRWMNRDPIGYDGGQNLYAYCGGDPVNAVDPSGEDGFWGKVWGGFVGIFYRPTRLPANQPSIGQDNPTIDANRDVDGVNGAEEAQATTARASSQLIEGEARVVGTVANSALNGVAPEEDAAGQEAIAVEKTAESVTDKLKRYLLNPSHPVGGPKADWFKRALGFDQSNASDLARQIVFDPEAAVETANTVYGQKYEQVINITGANGRSIPTKFVWIKNSDGIVRLVTGMPTR